MVFEGEAEVALVIGKHGTNIKAADAMSYIFGYVNFIDGSACRLPLGAAHTVQPREPLHVLPAGQRRLNRKLLRHIAEIAPNISGVVAGVV